ncbi:hypothetical protein CkaCkLH20_11752 [Colletotrichum karsti]|uniref:Uncharacterized protein n=1 Tax=Colletotrichum karsti TaxID=1095194 RepID=A0A9P6LEW3_9PEZI|nr:uncharacterized protein CkaCkLH20_11752 [Colletotrichum karsti]KAF9870853.1 hypothetical protein CkaCkLH20_11752 [Colletotrichum karsti]
MSAASSPSPSRYPGGLHKTNLPQGQCRYILLVPGIKGQRCACVHFSLNRSTPGASCDCGHLACYHVKSPEPSSNRQEVDLLRQRLHNLEEQLGHERQNALGSVIARVSELEELVDKSREEIGQEIKGSYRNITRVWQSVEHLERQTAQLQHSVRDHTEHLGNVNIELKNVSNRQMELFDADESMEERLEQLESDHDQLTMRRRPVGDVVEASSPSHGSRRFPHFQQPIPRRPVPDEAPLGSEHSRPGSRSSSSPGATGFAGNPDSCGAWTVHISLLPTFSQPFPFERDTNAYKRCLSRGLHRTVVVGGPSSNSFVDAVTMAFRGLLKGRSWMPLQAKLCDAERLQGLPMLRPLEPRLVDSDYDINFLRQHCGVCEPSGKIESLYIAMREDKLSWHFLRNSPKFIDGLENCWVYDHFLDPNDPVEDDTMDEHDRPSAGDIVPNLPSLKRAASEMSRANSLATGGTGAEGDLPRTKAPRTACLSTLVDSPIMDWDVDMDDVAEGFAPPTISIANASNHSATAVAPPEDVERDVEGTTLVPNKVHVRGLDTLTTDNIKTYVRDHYGSVDRVEWIDDASANLIFGTDSVAQEAIRALSAVEIADPTQLPLLETIPAKPVASHPEVNLQIRFAVLSDKKARGAAQRSRFYLFHPEFDPEERRRRNEGRNSYRDREGDDRYRRGGRARRERDRSVEVYDAGMYDDDEAALAEREAKSTNYRRSRSRDLDSREDRSFSRRNQEKELFPGRGSGSRSQRNRSASPMRDVDGDAKMDSEIRRAGTASNRERASGIRGRLAQGNQAKELFPTKGSPGGKTHMDRVMDGADEAARLMQSNMSVDDGRSGKRDLLNHRGRDEHQRGSNTGFAIKGAASANVNELFPDRFGGNAKKELFADKLEGRGKRRQKAEDLFS